MGMGWEILRLPIVSYWHNPYPFSMPMNHRNLSTDQELDGYRLIRFLGRGGFGEVWLCRSLATGGYHALKYISNNDPDLIEKEHHSLGLYRNAAAKLRSPHLVPIEHINRLAHGLYYVMPLADGIVAMDPADPAWEPLSLAALIDARTKADKWFSSREMIALISPLLDALQCLSDAGLVHRDVKPDNILFFHGSPCLGDISLLGEDAAIITRRGTPGYATPSWYQGGLPDMYGAAATLYTLLTGNSPDKIGRSAFLWPPQGQASLSEPERAEWTRLHAVICRAIEEKVGERYRDFRTMAAAISSIGKPAQPPALPGSASMPPPLPRRKKSKQPQLWAVALIISVVIIMVIAIAANLEDSKQNPSTPPPVAYNPSPPSTSGRAPKIVDSRGHFPSLRERVIEVIPAAISADPSGSGPRLSLNDYADQSAIRKTYQSGDYSGCYDLLDARIKKQPSLLNHPLCLLFKALLCQELNREDEMQASLDEFRKLPFEESTAAEVNKTGLSMRLTLLEALGLHSEAQSHATAAIEVLRPALLRSGSQVLREDVLTLMIIYRDRARARIRQGDMAGALADEQTALELLPGIVPGGSAETEEEARQIHLNTVVMEWELLEQEFPAYADYLEANGWPEPKSEQRE